MRRHVDRVAEGGELACLPSRDVADECGARVDPRAERDPWALLGAVPSSFEERPSGLHGPAGVFVTGHERQEEAHDLVSHELVEQRLVSEQDLGGDGVEALHQMRELEVPHLSGEVARATYIGEQERDVDLGAHHVRGSEPDHASSTEVGVLVPGTVLGRDVAQDEPAGTAERDAAELASRVGRQEAERPASHDHVSSRAVQARAPFLFRDRGTLRHPFLLLGPHDNEMGTVTLRTGQGLQR